MAELGGTTDPKALIPGEPKDVHAAADTLSRKAATLQAVADRLTDVRLDDWHGPASGAFWEAFGGEPRNWQIGQDSLNNASDALDAHANTLQWAQGQAAEAIELWERGSAATRRAATEAGGGSTTAAGSGGPLTPTFNDPGAALRRQAQEILDRARNQLAEGGRGAAQDIANAGGHGKDAPAWLSGPADFVRDNPKFARETNKRWERTFKDLAKAKRPGDSRFARYHKFGAPVGNQNQPKATFARWQGEANLFKVDAHGAMQVGDVTLAASAEAKVGVNAAASAYATRGNIGVDANASAGASASVQGGAVYGPAEVNTKARAQAGAEANVGASVGTHGVNAHAGAFAGASAGVDAHGDVGGVGAGASAEVRAGIGAEADFHAGMEDGKFKIGGEAGLSVGVGGKISVDIEIDPQKVVDTVDDVADGIGDVADDVGGAISDFGSALNPLD